MNAWQSWLLSWKGFDSLDLDRPLEIPSDAEDLVALGLLLEGLVDASSLRQARWLGTDACTRSLLLLLLARLRQGHPRGTVDDLAALVRPTPSLPENGWEGLSLPDLVRAQQAALPAFAETLRRRAAELADASSAAGPLFGPRTLTPLPLVVVERESNGICLGFGKLEAATDRLLDAFRARLAASPRHLPPARVAELLALLDTMPEGFRLHEGQSEAVAKALHERLVVLTGGPGTGKTTVVACMLWMLLEADPTLHGEAVVLCAPTGRAQARLAQSVQENIARLPGFASASGSRLGGLASLRSATLHSLLGARPDGSFRHHAGNPLPYRVVVVDEASMIDLSLFSSLLEAVSPESQLVLVGDPEQLPSVDPGAVLADLVASPSLEPHRAVLTHTWRNDGDIAACALALREGRWPQVPPSDAESMTDSVTRGSVRRIDAELERILALWVDLWTRELRTAPPSRRILCLTHTGRAGRQTVNAACDRLLRERCGVAGPFVPGQPVLLTRNHPERDLWNGDLGIVRQTPSGLVVEFPDTGTFVPPSRLEGLESAWAITVHKSQGSEFQEVLFLLPERDTPMLSRQIAYTALTRARKAVWLHGDVSLLAVAAGRREDRPSRLRRL